MNVESLLEPSPHDSVAAHEPGPTDLEAATHLRYVLHQSFRYRYAGPVATVEQRLVVVPPSRHGPQRRTFHRVSVVGADGRASWSRDDFSNEVARVQVPAVAESVEFQVEAVLERTGRAQVLLPGEALHDARYLEPTRLTAPDVTITTAARDLAGGAATGLETAERICTWVHEAVPYRKATTSVGTTAAEAFAIGAGVCQDHAHIMLAMCRALGLPARYVSGHMLGEGSTHAWVEVIAPHSKRAGVAVAHAFDPCHGRRPGSTYVTVASGRDYGDVAPTSGTYHGRFANELTSVTSLGVAIVDGPAGRGQGGPGGAI